MSHRHVPVVSLDPERLPLVLVGLPGAGKTTVARLLATALGVVVTDTDAEIRRRARLTIPQIFDTEGETGFRARETRALRAVLTGEAAAQGVVALGGGGILRPENRAMLAGRTVIYLEASPATAAGHVGDGAGRPLVSASSDSDSTEAAHEKVFASVLARMEVLHAERAPLYAEVATHTVPIDGLSPEQVAALVLVALGTGPGRTAKALAMASAQHAPVARVPQGPAFVPDAEGTTRVHVSGQRSYEVVIGHGLDEEVDRAVRSAPGAGAGGIAVVHPRALGAVARRYEAVLASRGLRVTRIEVPGGERAKRSNVLDSLWESLGDFRLGRDGMLIGVGGGATTDLVGFAAATWLRGVPVLQVPTTLLAMVDAAVGGKTGIDTGAGKNLVGAFHPPTAVIADLDALRSLPVDDLRSGLGEVVKCGFIADPVILDRILADPADCLRWDSPVLAELVARSARVKAAVVGEDLTEAGLREVLNYGHTYAHAVEKVTSYGWRHGEAVAVGCVFAAHVANRMGRLDHDTVALHRQALEAVGLPTSFPEGAGRLEDLVHAMLSDKKVRAGAIRMVLLDSLARPVRGVVPDATDLRAAHEAVTTGAPTRTAGTS
ncbi:3-dehydroquinate synthase [Actinomyces howellii]|uniref:Multifunctional fusion protein n=1 Tax=Actinomyces howellii TaxID=52771 RepID=A0A448HE42_9ACTO|nr:3-dehydroquinate synthase [Actinomyces howellii]VEG26011.1 3-dehydroquinate synthase [Actinomyces howellii]